MVVVVAVVVLPGRRFAALLAGIAAGVWFDFFLTKPYEHFTIQRSSDVQTTVLLLVVGVLVGEIAVRRRQARSEAEPPTTRWLACTWSPKCSPTEARSDRL